MDRLVYDETACSEVGVCVMVTDDEAQGDFDLILLARFNFEYLSGQIEGRHPYTFWQSVSDAIKFEVDYPTMQLSPSYTEIPQFFCLY